MFRTTGFQVTVTQRVDGYRVEVHRETYETREAAARNRDWWESQRKGYRVRLDHIVGLTDSQAAYLALSEDEKRAQIRAECEGRA